MVCGPPEGRSYKEVPFWPKALSGDWKVDLKDGCVFFFVLMYLFLERVEGREKERETLMGCLLHTPQLGTRHVP